MRARSGAKVLGTRRFRVRRPGDNPPRSFFRRKKLKEGVNYVKMRDGVELAMTVRLPAGKKIGDGPFPTVIEHSGYQIAAPQRPPRLGGQAAHQRRRPPIRSRRPPAPPWAR